ncbi:uncharacterized protein MYCGRDRAFT_95845 [Zymoseptoria tritici IPO323]|uniref:Uncharacterized protein n=1 Tax=Zymoseptoria tritici (strain CBS 115943 / IPO323) TaxID=336722 RepID=F9XJE5_ZYMTI|nr:uncharacterized protein MYCGRDRAFT_95845 [Zymoseptoria tritici IPO323]EGP84622.1 hypothetical protein MYCGRDRAFT_95845 [Zymoseptoria tritici IPO323]
MDADDAMVYFDFVKYDDEGHRHQTSQVCHRDSTPHLDGSDNQEPPSTDPFLSSDDDSQSMQWDLAKAARHDYFSTDPMQGISLPLTPPGPEDALMDPFAKLPPTFEEEKWNVDRETAQFLSSVMSLMSPSEDPEHDAHLGFRKFKVDEPLLSTDPIVDIQRLHERNVVSVTTAGMDFFVLSKKKDERLTWDKKSLKLPDQVEKEIASEKVVVDSETANFLKEVFQDMEGPALLLEDCRTKRKIRRLDELKISSPLLPLDPTEPPTKKAKTVAFSDDLASFLPSLESNDADEDPYEDAEDAMQEVAEMIAPLADVTSDQANDEELIEVDTTMRVPVPAVDEIPPAAPWQVHVGTQHVLIQDVKAGLDKTEKQWSGITSLERHLQWNAFPSRLGKPKPEGEFDDGSLARYLAELDVEGDPDISSIICKQEGLRILDPGEDDDDYLEPASGELDGHTIDLPSRPVSAVQPQLAPVLQELPQVERVLHATEGSTKESAAHAPGYQPQLTVPREPLEFSSLDALLKKRKDQLKPNPAGPTANTHTQSLGQGHLSEFLSMQGITPVASFIKTVPVAADPEPTAQPPTAPPPAPQSTTTQAFPTPSITHDDNPLPILISTTLLTNRPLIRSLNNHLPTLSLIERDYTTPQPPTPEADLTLSPSIGLTLTTLQRLKQKPLPGTRPDPNNPTFRTQLAAQADRYETLLVFITHPTPSPDHPLSPRDAEAMMDFTLFTTTSIPDTDVQVSLIPTPPGGDGTDVLAQWIAAAIIRYAPNLDPGMTVLQDETLWERWLRRAGMNAFAAQVVLDLLKAGKGEEGGGGVGDGSGDSMMSDGGAEGRRGGTVTGLAAFVMMSKEERMRRFAAVMGGTRVLERVGRVVDGRWRGGGGGEM